MGGCKRPGTRKYSSFKPGRGKDLKHMCVDAVPGIGPILAKRLCRLGYDTVDKLYRKFQKCLNSCEFEVFLMREVGANCRHACHASAALCKMRGGGRK